MERWGMGRRGWSAALLAGAAAGGVQAQQAPAPTAPTAPPRIEFRGPDGKPLPPEVQRELEEQFRKNPPPLVRRPAPGGAGAPGDIVVTGQPPRGAVIGAIPPERSFGPLDIRAYGADTVAALLDAIAPQTASNRGRGDGRPVTLLNGRRVSDFAEIARIPTEAIERMEVFPEELALRYGYRADQKVVNIVTFPNFRSGVGQLNYLGPTRGGRDSGIVAADALMLRGDTRVGLGITYTRAAALLESQRDLVQLPGTAGRGDTRTLLPRSGQGVVNGVVALPLATDVSATLNARFETNHAESLLGPGARGPLRRDSDREVAHLGTTLNGRSGRWQWSATGNIDRTDSRVLTDITDRRDVARFTDTVANADLLLAGPLAELPAGPVSASIRGGGDLRDFTGRSTRSGTGERSALSRNRGVAQLDLSVPLLGRKAGRASPLGELSLNANGAIERLSDIGTLRTFGYGLVWSPVEGMGLVASVTQEEGAPTLEQLGAPLLATPGVRLFDAARGAVVDVTRVTGGNAALISDDRHVVRLGANVRPLPRTDLTLSIDYVATRIDDPIAAFPIPTPQVEAALPDRFGRDAAGTLFRIDARPVNFAQSRQRQLRWGVDFTRPLAPVPPGMQAARTRVYASEADARRAHPNAIVMTAEPGSASARMAANMTSRWFLSLYHNWYLEDSITLRDGLPALDLLDGGAVDVRGGRRRHAIEFQTGVFKRGLGARVDANWQGATTIGGTGSPQGDLRFAGIATVNASVFANLGERFGGSTTPDWLKGMRATLGVTNLFNARPQVRDGTGATPISYQRAYLDPVGRSITLSLRKRL
ncbi:TonB-dependent receptor [Sphingomonas sp. VNH70]|uniref:TonB-dependent receptor n=1 Tax=Sphingomonas silueang TaxID=3156617 RepID=UPI0032B4CA9C